MIHVKLDRIDLKILTTLQESGRLSNKGLSERVYLSASPCLIRVKRLEKAGLITRYLAKIDVKRIADNIFVISQIFVDDANIRSTKLLEDRILSFPQTCEFYDVNGGCDYIVRFACRSTDDYYRIAQALLEDATLQVRQIASYIVLRELKSFSGYDLHHLLNDKQGEHRPYPVVSAGANDASFLSCGI